MIVDGWRLVRHMLFVVAELVVGVVLLVAFGFGLTFLVYVNAVASSAGTGPCSP